MLVLERLQIWISSSGLLQLMYPHLLPDTHHPGLSIFCPRISIQINPSVEDILPSHLLEVLTCNLVNQGCNLDRSKNILYEVDILHGISVGIGHLQFIDWLKGLSKEVWIRHIHPLKV